MPFRFTRAQFCQLLFWQYSQCCQKVYCIALPDLFLDDICESHWSRKFDYVVLVLHFQMVQLMHHLLLRLLYCIDRCQSRSHWYQMIRNQPTWNVFHQKKPQKVLKAQKVLLTRFGIKLRRRRIKSRIFLHKNSRDKSNIHFVAEINPIA